MTQPSDQNAEATRRLWPLVRLFGILTDIAAQEAATRQDIETGVPVEAGARLVAGDSLTVGDLGEDSTVEEAA